MGVLFALNALVTVALVGGPMEMIEVPGIYVFLVGGGIRGLELKE